MIENLPKNGSFLQRKKVFVQFPFHSLNHHSAFQWPEDRSSQEKVEVKNRPHYEKEYIRRLYNERVQRNLNAKFNAPLDSFRAIPNDITAKRDQEALNKEIQHFNQSKQLPNNNPQNKESLNENQPLQRNYQSAKQINNKPPVDQLYYPPHLYNSRNRISAINRKNTNDGNRSENSAQKEREKGQIPKPVSPRYSNLGIDDYKEQRLDLYKRPYLQKNYGPQSLRNYQNYAELINSSSLQPPVHPLRNYLPDRLQGYLRQNLKVQNKRSANNSVSVQSRLKI